MWRADKVPNDFSVDPDSVDRQADDSENEHSHAHTQFTAPHTLSFGQSVIGPADVAEPSWQNWRRQLSQLGGRSPLLHFVDSPRTRVELSTTHPGGLAQFITGKRTLLSSLIRDDIALRSAKIAAGAVAEKGLELSTARGIDAVHLGIGIARWSYEGSDFCAPVLLRPLAIRRHGRDFELKLRGSAILNPEFARALDDQFQVRLDAESFVALTDADGTFKPNPVIDRLRGLTSHLANFEVSPRLVVSSFTDVAPGLEKDASELQHPILDALAGNTAAAWTIKESYTPVPTVSADERSPQTDNLLLDADAEQENVIAQIEAGNSLVVRTLPGTGGTQTIVNAVGALVAQNKRVLVVTPRRASLQSIGDRFSDIGLPGLTVAPRTLRRDIIRSISRSEKATRPHIEDVDDALLRLRKIMLDYRRSMSGADTVLGVSVLDCVAELSRLALLPNPPSTTARLSREAVEKLAKDRSAATGVIIAAAKLGEFKYGPGDSPWYGAQFANGGEAFTAHEIAKRVNEQLPELLDVANRLVANTRMRPFQSIAELGVYLRLLVDLRETLDKFVPTVFDRAITELIAATAARRDFPDMTNANRRRLKKLALEYVRPGVRVTDMNAALVRIQKQRVLWHRFVAEGASPAVPVGIGEVQRSFQQVSDDLEALDVPLGIAESHVALASLPVPFLLDKISALAAKSDVLNNLQERTALMGSLRELKLNPLIDDLALRHVPENEVAAELELSWWKSALDSMLELDRALLNADTSVVDRLEEDFRIVDKAHASANSKKLSWQIAENWKIGLVDWPDEAKALKRALAKDRLTSFDVQTSAPHLSRTIAPVWLASPYEIDTVVDSMPFDTVILVDAGAMTVAEAAGAIRRSKQVVVFGDPVIESPTPFASAVRDVTAEANANAEAEVDDAMRESLVNDSAFARLSGLLPTLTLTRSYRPGGEELAELVNRRFYGGQIQSLPWAGSFLGHGSLAVSYVADGVGMPDPDSGAVESPDAEVARVVELVIDHATNWPNESLMVITASPVHAVRVMQSVLDAVANRHPDLIDVLIGDRAEPFAVITIDQAVAQSRDRVIFSIGYGRTPHGRVLSDFGSLGEPGGERLLAVAMTRARRSLEIVTSFRSEDLDDGRMKHGAVALAEVLDEVDARLAEIPVPDDSDPMLVDLARRLEKRGLRVALGHRAKLGLVASRGGRCGTIETDAMVQTSSLRESMRLRPELLGRLGWHYLRVHAFELFSDPEQVADKVARMLGAEPAPTTEPITIIPTIRPGQ
ncbi:MAG: AAA family ATPase [Rhodoglobus sp.]